MRNLFVTGTDTDAGKTFITAGIVRELRGSGVDAIPLKPVQTGCVNDIAPDLEYCLDSCGMSLSKEEASRLSPERFEPACSPHLAAELCGRELVLDRIIHRVEQEASAHQCTVAEGAGGILVPLGRGRTMLDLMKGLGWPVVLTVANRLGAINHSLLSIECLRHAGLDLAGVVINHVVHQDEPVASDNVRTIQRYGRVEILGEVPWAPNGFPVDAFTGICRRLKEILQDEPERKRP